MSRVTFLGLLGVVGLGAGCASVDRVPGANGIDTVMIQCGTGNPQQCYKEAVKACPNGYDEQSFDRGDLRRYQRAMLVVKCHGSGSGGKG